MSTMTRHAVGTFCWADLGTTDPEAAKKFYTGLFGWQAADAPMGNGEFYTSFTKNGEKVVALYPQQAPERARGELPSWNVYLAVDDVDAFAKKIEQRGGTIVMAPMDVMEHGRTAVCQDPTSAFFSLWQPKGHQGATIAGETGAMAWHELITTDAKKAGEFYQQVFGWTSETKPMPMGPYTIFKKDGNMTAGMVQATPEMKVTHPYWLMYFGVDDVDQAVAKAESLGGKTQLPPMDMKDVGRMAVVTDPQGAWFALFGMRKK
jgi:predicted enzyme related to lactoylglutathione lyase